MVTHHCSGEVVEIADARIAQPGQQIPFYLQVHGIANVESHRGPVSLRATKISGSPVGQTPISANLRTRKIGLRDVWWINRTNRLCFGRADRRGGTEPNVGKVVSNAMVEVHALGIGL